MAHDQVEFEQVLDSVVARDKQPRADVFLTLEQVEAYIHEMLNTLPRLDRAALRREFEQMSVPISQTPHTADLNKGLALGQAYRDRLSEIYLMAMHEYRVRERCIDMLFDAFNTVSKATSADKRKGEASLRYPVMLFQLQAAENFFKETEHMLSNMKSAMDAVSRQVSVFDIQLKLGDVQRRSKANGNDAEELEPIKHFNDWNEV